MIPSNDIANINTVLTRRTTSRGSRCAGSIGQRCHSYSAQSHGLLKHSEPLYRCFTAIVSGNHGTTLSITFGKEQYFAHYSG